ncbi:MAG: type I methionyl aminopeptidase [Planctomycetota bacterium]
MAIELKTQDQIERMRSAGRVVHQVHQRLGEFIRPGVTTQEIDDEAHRVFTAAGAKGLFKNYPTYRPGTGFPSHTCISVNEVVVHGIADQRVIEDGDVVGVDCGVQLDGWCGDAARTVLVGDVDPKVRELCEATEHVLQIAIENIRPGRRWSQVARLMQNYAEAKGYGIVKDFVGHGIGQKLHEDPKVPNFVSRELLANDIELRPGMVLAVEPMCNLGGGEVKTLRDGWTVVTNDGMPSAHYEHTIAVTEHGADVLTDGHAAAAAA